MKKSIGLIFLSALVMMSLCSCGNDAGSYGSQTASGSAAMGGSAGKNEAAEKTVVENINCALKSPYRNSSNYYEDAKNGCRQRKLDGAFVRNISFGKKGAPSLVFVTENEIFYVKRIPSDNGGRGEEELWSMPIEKTEKGDRPAEKDAKYILKDEIVGWAYFYANEDYVVYIMPYDFKVFDRKAGKYLKLQGEPLDKKCPPNNVEYIADCVCGDHVFFQCKHDGLYMYTLGEDKIIPIDRRTHGSYSAVSDDKRNQIIYERCDRCEEFDKNEEGHQVSWYLYDCGTGEKKKLVTEDVIQTVCQKNGLKDLGIWGVMFIDGDMLYSICDGYGFSFDLSSRDREPHYEKKFSDWLKKSKYNYYDVREIENGKCYFEEYDEDRDDGEYYITGYYDLKKDIFVKTDKLVRQ